MASTVSTTQAGAQSAGSRIMANWLPPILTFAIGIGLWEGLVRGFGIPPWLLPTPSAILATFLEQPLFLLSIGLYTFRSALLGFLIGCGLGILIAVVCVRFRGLAEALVPFSVASNAVPIVALAPLMSIWLGASRPGSKIAVVAVMTLFPTLINVYRGLMAPTPDALALMRSYGASQLQIFGKLRAPAALPFAFNAFKICATLSMIGAVVAEFFGGPINALGVYIKKEAGILHMQEAWAAILVACLFGIAFFLLINLIERLLMPWHVSVRSRE
jgi:NitT/TauT family transport system permease protein